MEPETTSSPASHPLRAVFCNDRGLRAGWRLLIFVAIFCLLFFAVLIPITAMIQRQAPGAVLTPEVQIIGESSIFLLILLATFIMSRIERRRLADYGLPLKSTPVLSRFFIGYVLLGFLPLSVCLFTLHLFHAFDFGKLALHGQDIVIFAGEWAVTFLLVGLAEEYLLRGYTLYTLADGIGFWPAAIVMAVLFGLGHAGNPGETRVGLIAAAVFALFASATLRYTGSLWMAVGAHAGWNWGQSFFYGVSDSGIPAQGHLLDPAFHGPEWLTGGSVGPEGSVVTLILWTLMTVAFVLFYSSRGPALVITADQKK